MGNKKLIETLIPVSKICAEAEKEKTGKLGLPSNVHIWWTRTPYVVSRTLLFASLIDDPSEHQDRFPTLKSQDKERNRLIALIEKMSEDSFVMDNNTLDKVKAEILKNSDASTLRVFDPFVGSGSVPVEAHRLGLCSCSADINPVSSIITTALSDIPSRFPNAAFVHRNNKEYKQLFTGITEDILFYGNRVIEKAYKKIGHLFPTITVSTSNEQVEVAAWIWARTVKCPNPACNCQMPLSFCYDLAKKKGNETWVEPVNNDGQVHFKIRFGNNTSRPSKAKVANTAVFRCPICGEITTDDYVKECGSKKEINYQLLAIAAEENGKRVFIEATKEQEQLANVARPKHIPHGMLPVFPSKFSPPSFGYLDYADLYTNRQLVFLTTMVELTRKIQIDIEKDAIKKGYEDDKISFVNGGSGALAYSEAIRIVLMLTLSKLLDRYSNLCSWNSNSGGAIRNVFSRAAMPMIWDFAEGNPFSSAGGSYYNTLLRVCESYKCLPFGIEGITTSSDASVPNPVRNSIVLTDMPYYDRIPYQELSDYFYVWLKYGLDDIYPSLFDNDTTLKTKDMTAFAYRYSGNSETANAIYIENMRLAIRNIYDSATTLYPSVIGFMYKHFDGTNEKLSAWEHFVTAVYDAGFSITSSWPLYGRKTEEFTESNKQNAMPIFVVVRKYSDKQEPITRRLFVSIVKREIPRLIEEMNKCVSFIDLRASVIGKAMDLFMKYKCVIDADGSKMKPYIASRIIEQEIDTQIDNYIKATNTDETIGGN